MRTEDVLAPLEIPVFRCAGETVTFRDVMDFGWFNGTAQRVWGDLRLSLARTETAEGLEMEPGSEELQAMSDEFRYQLDLISAEEAERWLGNRGLTASAFAKFFQRRYWLQTVEEPEEVEGKDFLSANGELRELLRVDLLLTGEFNWLSTLLSWRWAAAAIEDGRARGGAAEIEKERELFLERTELTEETLASALAGLGRDADWLNGMLNLEGAFQQARVAILTDSNRAGMLHAMQLGLIRAQIERVHVPSLEAGKEAVLCVREGVSMLAEVASECGGEVQAETVFLDDATEEFQQLLLSTSAGELMAPRDWGDGFTLTRVVKKIEPDLEDPEVKARIDTRLLTTRFSEAASDHIQWLLT